MATAREAAAMLQIVHLEDDPADRLLVEEILAADGLTFNIVAVQTRREFEATLERPDLDIILADFQLPAFDGLTAQSIAKKRAPDLPFIFVSGTLGEEIAVERLKDGATDYVLKQRLSRLPSAVRRAIAEAATRAERARAERAVHELNAELELRVARRTADLAAAMAVLAERERELRNSEARLRAILTHSPAMIYVKDCDGRYVLVNQQFEMLVKRPAAEIVGATDLELFGERLGTLYRAHDSEVLTLRRPCEFEEPAFRDDGLHIYTVCKFPLRDSSDEIYAVCGIAVDVTARHHMEEAARLAQLEAERANRAKSTFLSHMSHELRTPLHAILGFAQVLQVDTLEPEQRDSVRQIVHGGHHLLNLINELLDFARIESGHLSLSLEPVDVNATIQHVLMLIQPLTQKHQVTVRFEPGPPEYVHADRQRFTQIMLNLVSNAAKYNRPAGTIAISTDRSVDGRLTIRVTDTGRGIALQQRDRLFEAYERLGADGTAIEGTGLGLSVCKRLTEAMGGTIGFETAVDIGSTFWVDLPRSEAALQLAASPAEPRSPVVHGSDVTGTVLCVDDNAANRLLLERILRARRGVRLVTAGTAAEGLELARANRPDLLLLDLHLPDMHGDDVLRVLQEDDDLRGIPVAVVSADATLHQQQRLKASAAVDYLTKPFSMDRLLSLVDEQLSRRR